MSSRRTGCAEKEENITNPLHHVTATGWVYDSGRGVTVLFGGDYNLDQCTEGGELKQDTWEWNGTTWTDVKSEYSPLRRQDHALVYDEARGVVLLFGGHYVNDMAVSESSDACTDDPESIWWINHMLQDTWEWDGEAWNERVPPYSLPPHRRGHGMVYDVARGEILLFGGYGNSPDDDFNVWGGTTVF